MFMVSPLNNSIHTADEFSSKLPVTDLYGAPLLGADSNLHWYKCYVKKFIYLQINFLLVLVLYFLLFLLY